MLATDPPPEKFMTWVAALDARHFSDLTPSEVARALRALSSCYVERREKLAAGDALGSRGKRAAFALFYAPQHFLVTWEILRALEAESVTRIVDLGCGTGAAGAAWALRSAGVSIGGFDRHPWAVAEASWTYRVLGLSGRARQADISNLHLRVRPGEGVIAAYALNELAPAGRASLLSRLLDAARADAHVLVVEPIARRAAPWWQEWATAFAEVGGRVNQWRFAAVLPPRQEQLARAAGLDPRELTARSIFV